MKPKFTTETHRRNCAARAQANADYFGKPYSVFSDTSGNWRVEPFNESAHYERETFYPKAETATSFLLRDSRGRGFLAVNASTSFDLPRNWTPKPAKAQTFADFAEASAHAQAFFARGSVSIVAKP